jgi:enhancing lycopene biosynthesis protein 2
MARKKVLFVLSGCGNRDGSEIHEAVCALLALEEAGLDAVCTAPEVMQSRTLSYINGRDMEHRNAFEESARISRGKIRPLSSILPLDYDAVLLPGGMGAASTLCSYAAEGTDCTVRHDVRKVITDASAAGKPIAAMCIAPIILARLLPGVLLTFGSKCDASEHARQMGAMHAECGVDDAVVDYRLKVVSTPAYMIAKGPGEVLAGARRMVEELAKLIPD